MSTKTVENECRCLINNRYTAGGTWCPVHGYIKPCECLINNRDTATGGWCPIHGYVNPRRIDLRRGE